MNANFSAVFEVWIALIFISQPEFEELKAALMQISGLIQKFISYLQQSDINGVRKKTATKDLKL